jgi:YD repeat-containing protein
MYFAILLLTSLSAVSAAAETASVTYTYDLLGRVTTALYDNGTCVAYTYDANGNRTAKSFTNSGTPASPIWGSGVWGCFPWTPASK